VGLEEIYFEPEANISPGSMQPVIYLDASGAVFSPLTGFAR
jgi:hypothetical protein